MMILVVEWTIYAVEKESGNLLLRRSCNLLSCLYRPFSNSLIIHKEITKKLMFNECLEIRWKTAQFCVLNFSFWNHFVWEAISSIWHSVSSPDETPRSLSKILHCVLYFELPPWCFIRWWNTASHAWYITSKYDSFHIISIHYHYFKSVLLFISLLRWFVAYQSAMSFRFSHYFVSFLSECTSLLSGIGTEVNQEGKQLTIW